MRSGLQQDTVNKVQVCLQKGKGNTVVRLFWTKLGNSTLLDAESLGICNWIPWQRDFPWFNEDPESRCWEWDLLQDSCTSGLILMNKESEVCRSPTPSFLFWANLSNMQAQRSCGWILKSEKKDLVWRLQNGLLSYRILSAGSLKVTRNQEGCR